MLQKAKLECSSQLIQDGYSYWQSKRIDQNLPSWSDINPAEIKSLLPNIVVLHVDHDPLNFIEKITGDVILSRSVKNTMGISWRDYEGRGPGSKIWQVMEEVVDSKQPSFHHIPYVGLHKEFMEIETVACPISDDGKTVCRIMCFVEYVPFSEEEAAVEYFKSPKNRFTL
ncbi:MAG: PAS domain-containing protein [Sneathiella sp.]|nr:PAS domain-containing protein [Sneathiella sp.]